MAKKIKQQAAQNIQAVLAKAKVTPKPKVKTKPVKPARRSRPKGK